MDSSLLPPRLGKAKGCWTLNGKALQRNALVRSVCMSDSSAWNTGGVAFSAAMHRETLSTAEQVQQEVTEAEEAVGSNPECWGCEQGHCPGWLPDWYDSVYLQESTEIPDSVAFFFLLAQPLQCCHLAEMPSCMAQVSTHCWCLLTSVSWETWCIEKMKLTTSMFSCWIVWVRSSPLNPVGFTWVMWNANAVLWAPDSQVVQQGGVNMSWQENVHQRLVDFSQNNRQLRHFHSAWDILSFYRIIFWEHKTHKEVSILPNLLFGIFAMLC